MWDEPSAEVTQMKKVCETMLEEAEEDIEEWYYHHQDQNIQGEHNFILYFQKLNETKLFNIKIEF